MAFKSNKAADKGGASDLIVKSIGVCLAYPDEKKKAPLCFVSYISGAGQAGFAAMPIVVKTLYERNDFLSVIATAESVKHVTYVDENDCPKDIYVCRAACGRIIDIVDRDENKNRYVDGFAEVMSARVKFNVHKVDNVKPFAKLSLAVTPAVNANFTENSYEYAIVNAYNAALLGRLFEREELALETKGGNRVKIEVRNSASKFVDDQTLFIKPILQETENTVDYYMTEEFNYIDGDEVSRRAYKIVFSNRFNDYNLIRQ